MKKTANIIDKLFNSKLLEMKREFLERYKEKREKAEGQASGKLRLVLADLEIKCMREGHSNSNVHQALKASLTAKSNSALRKELEELELKEINEAKELKFLECESRDSMNKTIFNFALGASSFIAGIVATKIFDYFF